MSVSPKFALVGNQRPYGFASCLRSRYPYKRTGSSLRLLFSERNCGALCRVERNSRRLPKGNASLKHVTLGILPPLVKTKTLQNTKNSQSAKPFMIHTIIATNYKSINAIESLTDSARSRNASAAQILPTTSSQAIPVLTIQSVISTHSKHIKTISSPRSDSRQV